jgi:K+-transporting ATPase ATPase A chain
MFAIFDSAGLTLTFGRMAKDRRGGGLFGDSLPLLRGRTAACWEAAATDPTAGAGPRPGNMEGKEVRFSVANSALYAKIPPTRRAARLTRHDSFTPLGGWFPLFNIQLGGWFSAE